jgi:hypothetical protein
MPTYVQASRLQSVDSGFDKPHPLTKEKMMKAKLIAVAMLGLVSGVAFAEPTLTHDDDRWAMNKFSRVEATQYRADAKADSISEHLFSFNP